ncbi:hypothetical protein H5410_064129 [Solanum commersonii]|uniref:Uncharacterized protein n=1 Tax=Solanum commersonii TaxID=4109 RepID=A0A9J5W060_SOLCO|nr:hypothetical protein H5410_064129 [Solanum commersonii]
MHPILVLDKEFFEEKRGTIGLIENAFSNMIDNILLKHVGSLVKFFLDLSIIYCNGRDLDRWLLCVTSKRLTLKFIKFCSAKANFVLNTPLLSPLTLIACNGVHLLIILAPRIKFLTIDDSHDIHTIFKKNSQMSGSCHSVKNLIMKKRGSSHDRFFFICVFNSSRETKIGEVTYYLEDPNCVDQ